MKSPQTKSLSSIYREPLSNDDSVKCRRLIESDYYQRNSGSRYVCFMMALDESSSEKSGVGGSIPSLATTKSTTYRPPEWQFHSNSFQIQKVHRDLPQGGSVCLESSGNALLQRIPRQSVHSDLRLASSYGHLDQRPSDRINADPSSSNAQVLNREFPIRRAWWRN